MPSAKPSLAMEAFQAGSDLLVALQGRLVLENHETVRKRLHDLLDARVANYFIYMGRLDYVDSAGWGAMVGLKMAATRHRVRLVILAPSERIAEVLRISRLETIFEVLSGSEAELVRLKLELPEHRLWGEVSEDRSAQTAAERIARSLGPGGLPTDEATRGKKKEIERLSRDALEHYRHGDFAKAAELYRQVLELNPEDLSALNNLGVICTKRPDWYQEAVKVWRRVLEVSRARGDERHIERAQRHLQTLDRMMSG